VTDKQQLLPPLCGVERAYERVETSGDERDRLDVRDNGSLESLGVCRGAAWAVPADTQLPAVTREKLKEPSEGRVGLLPDSHIGHRQVKHEVAGPPIERETARDSVVGGVYRSCHAIEIDRGGGRRETMVIKSTPHL